MDKLEKRKMGRPLGSIKPDARCHSKEKTQEAKRVANQKYKNTLAYTRGKIKRFYARHNLVLQKNFDTLGETELIILFKEKKLEVYKNSLFD